MILVPATSLDDWKERLSNPDSEWQPGSSAHELAARWSQRTTFPPEIAALFDGVERTQSATLLLALPEHQVPLAGGARASSTDLWILARTTRGLLSVVVEGTVNGSFGRCGHRPLLQPNRSRLRRLSALRQDDGRNRSRPRRTDRGPGA
jgi:hypothetical protein